VTIKWFGGGKITGLSTDTKPTLVPVGTTFYEEDTGNVFVWNGSTWQTAAAGGGGLQGLASFYVDDVLIADQGIDGSTKLKDLSVTTSKLSDLSVTASKLDKTSVLSETALVLGMSPRGLASDSTGVKHETGNTFIPSWVTSMFSAAYFEVSLLQLTGGTIALELYDGTAVITSISRTATTYRTRGTTNILSSIAGKEVRGRLNVTTAGGAGSLAGDATYKIVFVR